MPDEAVIRIVLDAEKSPAAVDAPNATEPAPPREMSFEERRAERQRVRAERDRVEAAEVRAREEELADRNRQAAEESELVKAEVGGTSAEERRAQRQRDREERQLREDAEVAAREAELADRNHRAAEELEARKRSREYDPVEVAELRLEAEREWLEAGNYYAKIDGKAAKTGLDSMLEALEGFRGTTGAFSGRLGRIAGAALDVFARLRKDRRGRQAELERLAPTAQVANDEGAAGREAEIAKLQGQNPEPGSPMGKKLASLISQRPVPAVPLTSTESSKLQEAVNATSSRLSALVPIVRGVNSAFNSLNSAAERAASRYEDYSPEISQAKFLAEFRTMLGDMRRAQENSRELSEFIRAQSEFQNRVEDVKMALLNRLVPILTGFLETLNSLLGLASKKDVEDRKLDPTNLLKDPASGGLLIPAAGNNLG